MVLHTKSADFLKQLTLRVQIIITVGYIKILKSGISRENHQLSIDVLIIWFTVLLRKLWGLKNWPLSCKMGGWPVSHDAYCSLSGILNNGNTWTCFGLQSHAQRCCDQMQGTIGFSTLNSRSDDLFRILWLEWPPVNRWKLWRRNVKSKNWFRMWRYSQGTWLMDVMGSRQYGYGLKKWIWSSI